jgi:hypothetical protein
MERKKACEIDRFPIEVKQNGGRGYSSVLACLPEHKKNNLGQRTCMHEKEIKNLLTVCIKEVKIIHRVYQSRELARLILRSRRDDVVVKTQKLGALR